MKTFMEILRDGNPVDIQDLSEHKYAAFLLELRRVGISDEDLMKQDFLTFPENATISFADGTTFDIEANDILHQWFPGS